MLTSIKNRAHIKDALNYLADAGANGAVARLSQQKGSLATVFGPLREQGYPHQLTAMQILAMDIQSQMEADKGLTIGLYNAQVMAATFLGADVDAMIRDGIISKDTA